MPTLKERATRLRKQRKKLIEENREIYDRLEEEGRDAPDATEQDSIDKRNEEKRKLEDHIKDLEDQVRAEESLEQVDPADRPGGDDSPEQRNKPDDEEQRTEAAMVEYRDFLRWGRDAPETEEQRALQADSDGSGGFTVAPQQFVADLIKKVDDMLFIRQLANVETLTEAKSLGVVSLDSDPADADWTSELATGSEDSDMDFGNRELNPHPLAKRLKVSNKLVRSSAIGIEALVRDRLAYKFGVTEEKAFLTGSGSQQPLGLFTADDDGISTSRDVSDGNTTTSIEFDGLKSAKYSLKSQYHASASWIFHRDAVEQIDKLKDGDGQYIWQASVTAGQPDRMLGFPVRMSEFAPNTFTTGLYVGILGDYSFYWIVDALSMTVQRLVELYAETNQIGFIGRMELDGMPVLEEAFARVTLA